MLANTNFVPGMDSNADLTSCGYFTGGAADPNCNDAASMALGLSFTLGASDEEVLTFTVSQTQPTSGFYLSTTDPTTGTTDYFQMSGTSQPTGPAEVPEPTSWVLLATLAG